MYILKATFSVSKSLIWTTWMRPLTLGFVHRFLPISSMWVVSLNIVSQFMDSMKIADGPSPSDRILRRLCRKELSIQPVTSESNTVTVRYRQHGGNHFPPLFGFLAQFSTGEQLFFASREILWLFVLSLASFGEA